MNDNAGKDKADPYASDERDPLLGAGDGDFGPSLDSIGPVDTVLVLGGGAMRGMAHIGVLRAIDALGIKIDAIVGTSIGSLIGAMAAGSASTADLEERLPGLAKDDYFQLNLKKFLRRGLRAPSMYSGETLRKSLQKLIPDETFDELTIPFFCNAVCLETRGPVFFGTRGLRDISIVDAVYGSCALPAVFEPLEWKGRHFMDGGITDALPLRFAKLLNPKRIIAVDLTVKPSHRAPRYRASAISTFFRAFDIVENVLTEQMLHMHVSEEVCLIQPKLVEMDRFDFGLIHELVDGGEREAYRVLTSHPLTRGLIRTEGLQEGVSCPVAPHEYVSLHIDPSICIGCSMCEMTCETGGFLGRGDIAVVAKPDNYECTRDQACVRSCPTGAIRLGNL
ncbi:MAG: patatin-like phospholipase family protein [Planctomycetota bacterium]